MPRHAGCRTALFGMNDAPADHVAHASGDATLSVMLVNVPGLLRHGRYRIVAVSGEVTARYPWCGVTDAHRSTEAQGVLGNGSVLPVREQLLMCGGCGKASIRAGLAARLLGGIAMLALTLFVLPLFCGAAYFAAAFVLGLLRGAPFDAPLAGLCAIGLPLTGVAVWIPLRRLIEALRSGPARVELPVEDLPQVR